MEERESTKILIADDDKLFIRITTDMLEKMGYLCVTAEDGLSALEMAGREKPDIILLDVVMPGLDGFEVVRRLKENIETAHIPIILVTILSDRNSRIRGLSAGADELLSKPVDEAELGVRIKNLLKIKRYEDYLVKHGRFLESMVRDKTLELKEAYEKTRNAYMDTIYKLSLAVEYRDRETGNHIKRISIFSRILARQLGLSEKKVEEIFFASPMHDIGKIGIPDSILLKPASLTEEEFETMKTHTTIGARILHGSDSEIVRTAEAIALTHHENWDGSGYPQGLKGEDIPLSGRIVHIVDVYDAARSKRPYRKERHTHEETLMIIKDMKRVFDPKVFDAFFECEEVFRRLYDENEGGEPISMA